MIKKIDTEAVKHRPDGQITAGRLGSIGEGGKKSNEGLLCMHPSPLVDLLSPPLLPNLPAVI